MHLDHQHWLKDVLKDMVEDLHLKEKLNETKIRQVWRDKMGTTINHYTHEIKLRKDKLFISIDSAALKQEMSYEKEKIKAMMNAELGGNFVKEVIVK
jgi:hypothetical protein